LLVTSHSETLPLLGRSVIAPVGQEVGWQGAEGVKDGGGIGGMLAQHDVNRAIAVSNNAGVRAILVHAIHDRAKQFYEHYGFEVSSAHPMTLMLRLTSVKF
jgi:hypothetical protein